MSGALSEYELVRLENIKRNEEFLKSMGLYKDPNAPPYGEDAFKTATKKKHKPKRKVELKDLEEENLGQVRRSSRNSGSVVVKEELISSSEAEVGETQPKAKRRYDPYGAAAKYFEKKEPVENEEGSEYSEEEEENGKVKRVVIQPPELRAFVESISPEHSAMISNSAVQLCAYRSAYMSIAALKNRVKAISGGAGKKSHEKLLIVTYAMRAMGLNRIAETAAALLKRNTGIVVTFGDSSGGDVTGTMVKEEAVSSGAADENIEIKTENVDGGILGNSNSANCVSDIVKSETLNECDNIENDNTTANTFVNPVPEPLHITKAKARAAKLKADKLAKAEKKKTNASVSVKLEPVANEDSLISEPVGNDDEYF
eukprot:gene10792-12587_t